ncbi:hypothetical protein GVN21_16725 [Caulobacter sp. SLTY]|uniref:hypothetical protein n=1 Tax=Caulobacter sp. SLTY TaxID=2683262 RepID=UPI001411E27E|nr:hypothetical protein [Caulobacter sp. SLTY]NBB17012.1 hypothetical protein [Caulobacter sp. SLTY]
MSRLVHSQGPLTVYGGSDWYVVDQHRNTIAKFGPGIGFGASNDTARGNAQLFKASPALIRAARMIDDAFGDAPNEAIAAAFGQAMVDALEATCQALAEVGE